MPASERSQLDLVRSHAQRLNGDSADYDDVVERAGECSLVLIGEATHGTHEFYQMRADISRRLIDEKGFEAIAVEGDWPDCYRVNRYVRGVNHDDSALEALGDFQRFPRWMWRNAVVEEFAGWLRTYNADRPLKDRVGFYGMDMYSLYRSADAVIGYLEKVDYEQAEIARHQYAALDHVRDPQRYGYEAAMGLRPDCSAAVREQLCEMVARAKDYQRNDGPTATDDYFFAERNAYVVAHAETYYRAMFGSRVASWNLRDAHMVHTLFALQRHLQHQGGRGRILVWAHNSHVGDARATDMSLGGEHNVGQLVRERGQMGDALLIGFTTYTGTVAAAEKWDGDVRFQRVKPAMSGSYEELFYRTKLLGFYLPLKSQWAQPLAGPQLERAIGVLYLPQSERESHYLHASLPAQFDVVFHIDETRAVDPLD
ncbi:erythromycin esterase family protein [Dyella japonica]|uniref:Erythromycin esterase-like protein n=1 Tax=Dyella japonica TaxID=231455 RepID=A0ABV2JP59_9GAMM